MSSSQRVRNERKVFSLETLACLREAATRVREERG